jgi:hypothetical protein
MSDKDGECYDKTVAFVQKKFQSGKVYKATVKDLSLEDGQAVTEEHLEKGTEVLYEHNKKSYPVTVISEEEGKCYLPEKKMVFPDLACMFNGNMNMQVHALTVHVHVD